MQLSTTQLLTQPSPQWDGEEKSEGQKQKNP